MRASLDPRENPGPGEPGYVPVGKWVKLHAKYAKPETSGLTFEVGKGDNVFDVRLDQP